MRSEYIDIFKSERRYLESLVLCLQLVLIGTIRLQQISQFRQFSSVQFRSSLEKWALCIALICIPCHHYSAFVNGHSILLCVPLICVLYTCVHLMHHSRIFIWWWVRHFYLMLNMRNIMPTLVTRIATLFTQARSCKYLEQYAIYSLKWNH